jgi:hypothetical protein
MAARLDKAQRPQAAANLNKHKGRKRPLAGHPEMNLGLALARLEARIGLADHEHLAATAHDLAVAVATFGRLEGGQNFHQNYPGAMESKIIVCFAQMIQ